MIFVALSWCLCIGACQEPWSIRFSLGPKVPGWCWGRLSACRHGNHPSTWDCRSLPGLLLFLISFLFSSDSNHSKWLVFELANSFFHLIMSDIEPLWWIFKFSSLQHQNVCFFLYFLFGMFIFVDMFILFMYLFLILFSCLSVFSHSALRLSKWLFWILYQLIPRSFFRISF